MSDPVEVAAQLSDDAIDSELSLAVLGYDPSDKYPVWSNSSMRFAYRAGFEDGYREALRELES